MMRTATRDGRAFAPSNGEGDGHADAPREASPSQEQPGAPPGEAEEVAFQRPEVTYIEMMIGEVNIVNHYGCQSQPKHATMGEESPATGREEGGDVPEERSEVWITIQHAAELSEQNWPGRGRSRQAIADQLHHFRHLQSAPPPKGGRRGVLIDMESFLKFDRAAAPQPDRSRKAEARAS